MTHKTWSNNEKIRIYKILRSCRLCGADEGYKMPIIQNIVEFEEAEELRQLIKECTQIEVSIDDKMPPLICEPCIEKLNNIHTFKLLCKDTNNQTRTRLGLSPHNPSPHPVAIEQPPSTNAPQCTQPPPPRNGSCPLNQRSSNRIVKNSKQIKSASSTSKPRTEKNISKNREETTSNNVKKVTVIGAPLEVPQKYIKHNLHNTTQGKLASVNIKEADKSIHTESSSDIGTESIETNPMESMINCKSRSNTAIKNYNSDKKYKCNFCTYSTNKSGHLVYHERIHTGEKPFKCNLCEKRFTRLDVLKLHQRIHTGEKPYKCNVCDYRSARLSHLKDHESTHTGEKSYKCNMCKCSFAAGSNLLIHKRAHTGEKPYKCNMCKYRCTNSGSLKKHKKTHTDQKPYECNVCEYRCRERRYLKIHIGRHNKCEPKKSRSPRQVAKMP